MLGRSRGLLRRQGPRLKRDGTTCENCRYWQRLSARHGVCVVDLQQAHRTSIETYCVHHEPMENSNV